MNIVLVSYSGASVVEKGKEKGKVNGVAAKRAVRRGKSSQRKVKPEKHQGRAKAKGKRGTWSIDDLKTHPSQKELFRDLPEKALNELADDLKENGLWQAVEILPDGTILCGHQRVRAARKLQWKEIQVLIRDDLQGDPRKAEKRMIEDNLNRRQLGKLDTARCYKRLKEAEKARRKRRKVSLDDRDREDLRDQIGKRLGLSGRTLDRYLRILETPQAVQDAFEADRLSLVKAEQVAGLEQEQQQEIAAKIEMGATPKQVVEEALGSKPRAKDSHVVFKEFVGQLHRLLDILEEKLPQFRTWDEDREKQLALLKRSEKLIGRLIEDLERCRESGQEPETTVDVVERAAEEMRQVQKESYYRQAV